MIGVAELVPFILAVKSQFGLSWLDPFSNLVGALLLEIPYSQLEKSVLTIAGNLIPSSPPGELTQRLEPGLE
jgi:hypothetical protein